VVLDKISWTTFVKNEARGSQRGKEHHTYTTPRRKDNWIGYSFCRNYLLKHVTEDRSDRKTRKKM
jgi:hypothetical protein